MDGLFHDVDGLFDNEDAVGLCDDLDESGIDGCLKRL